MYGTVFSIGLVSMLGIRRNSLCFNSLMTRGVINKEYTLFLLIQLIRRSFDA